MIHRKLEQDFTIDDTNNTDDVSSNDSSQETQRDKNHKNKVKQLKSFIDPNKLLLQRYYPLRQIGFGPYGHILYVRDIKKNKYFIIQVSSITNTSHDQDKKPSFLDRSKLNHTTQYETKKVS